jgi:hypothetical protein
LNFNNPIARATQPFFSEGSGLRSVRDSDALGRQWQKNSNVSAQNQGVLRVLEKMQRDINRIRRRVLPAIPAQQEMFFPFKVYQPSNLGAYVGMTVPMYVDQAFNPSDQVHFGIPKSCVVTDTNTPTNLAANPPTVSIADTWRFFCVRSGIIEYRPIYSLMGFFAPEYNLPQDVPSDPNNWALKSTDSDEAHGFIFNTDGVGTWQSLSTFDENPYSLISPNVPQVCVIGITPNGTTGFSVQLWINIAPDTVSNFASFSLYGIVQQESAFDQIFWWQSGQDIIPVAEVYFDVSNNFYPYQFLFDHVSNRYNPGDGNFNGKQGALENFRGRFNGNIVAEGGVGNPSDLLSQLFYPGDVIIVSNFGNVAGTFYPTWARLLFTGSSPAFISDWSTATTESLQFVPGEAYQATWFDSNWTVIDLAADPYTVYQALQSLGWPGPG